MKKIMLISLILIFTTANFAQDTNVSFYANMEDPADLVNPDGFFEYMIIKGDCLWFIADDFYSDPFKWTKIHEANPYIVNPDWIYPNNWLVIPNIYADDSGKPFYGLPPTKTIAASEPTRLVALDSEGNAIINESGEAVAIEGYGIDSDSDGVIDGYDTNSDGHIDVDDSDALTLEKYNTTKAKMDAKSKAAELAATAAASEAAPASSVTKDKTDHKCDETHKCDKPCSKSYCGKPGWKLGLHAGYPVGGGPENENLNLGLLLGTPFGVKVGPLSVGLGAGAFTYDFDNLYFGGGILASLCVNDLLKLDIPLILQLHGVGFYIFGEEQGLGFGTIGSASLPLGKSPISLGLYGALGKYYPNDNDYNWSNVGAVLFYAL